MKIQSSNVLLIFYKDLHLLSLARLCPTTSQGNVLHFTKWFTQFTEKCTNPHKLSNEMFAVALYAWHGIWEQAVQRHLLLCFESAVMQKLHGDLYYLQKGLGKPDKNNCQTLNLVSCECRPHKSFEFKSRVLYVWSKNLFTPNWIVKL